MRQERYIKLENGNVVPATFPIIVSASRSTDIPAFYVDWFFERLKRGYSVWKNPFNGSRSYVAYADTKFIVFWSKNPKKLLPWLPFLKERGIGCYIQYTLNDYVAEGFEPGVPALAERIETFLELVEVLGKGSVVWRFDPLMRTEHIGIDRLIEKIGAIGEKLQGRNERLIFSFADIAPYRKVGINLRKNKIPYLEWDVHSMREFALKLVNLNRAMDWNYELAVCGEDINLPGLRRSSCVDSALILRLHPAPELCRLLGQESGIPQKMLKDSGQRKNCRCIKSKDIGEYHTCAHGCVYCYANSSPERARANWERYLNNSHAETISGQ